MQAPRKPTIRPIHARDDREPFQTSVRHYHRSSTQQGELPEGSMTPGQRLGKVKNSGQVDSGQVDKW